MTFSDINLYTKFMHLLEFNILGYLASSLSSVNLITHSLVDDLEKMAGGLGDVPRCVLLQRNIIPAKIMEPGDALSQLARYAVLIDSAMCREKMIPNLIYHPSTSTMDSAKAV